MNLATIRKALIDNSPQLLTAVGVVGTVTTAFLTGQAAYKSAMLIRDELDLNTPEYRDQDLMGPREKINLCWKLYIPAIGTGVLTVSAIVGASHISNRRAAGLVAAYSLSEKAFADYKDKVIENIGEKKERAVRDEIAQDRVTNTPGSREVIISGTEILCLDTFSGRYFKSSMESLKKAQNDLNYSIINDAYATLSDLYDKMGLSRTQFSDEVGWSHNEQFEFEFSTAITEDQQPCLTVSFRTQPIRDFYKFH